MRAVILMDPGDPQNAKIIADLPDLEVLFVNADDTSFMQKGKVSQSWEEVEEYFADHGEPTGWREQYRD